jgi:hypothetical protein
MAASCCPIEQGLTPCPVGHHNRLGRFLLCADACLCLLLVVTPSLLADWCRAVSPSSAVAMELQGQLLARGREMDSREGTIAMWEDGLATFAHALGEVHKKCDTSRIRTKAAQKEFFVQASTSSSRSKQLTDLNYTLEEHQILLCL